MSKFNGIKAFFNSSIPLTSKKGRIILSDPSTADKVIKEIRKIRKQKTGKTLKISDNITSQLKAV